MANNELSGPTVITAIAKWLTELAERKYTYRIVYVPETIGPLVYMSKNLNTMKENIIAGFNITCIGDDRSYSYMTSRNGSTLSDKAAKHVLKHIDTNFKSYQWSQRGSDERQYCSPGADLPIASIMRTKWAEYPEYHTSDDDLGNVVTPDGLFGGFEALKKTLEAIEENCTPIATFIGEPQLGKRGLYPNLSTRVTTNWVPRILEFLTWCDGDHDLFDISEKCKCPIWDLYSLRDRLVSEGLIKLQNTADR
jgi:aminopeptidase-like protein